MNHDEPIDAPVHAGHGAKRRQSQCRNRSGNVVGAIEMAEKYGCDTGRMYTLFAAPPEKDLEWSEQGIEGCARFLNRVYRLVEKHAARLRGRAGRSGAGDRHGEGHTEGKDSVRKTHQTLKRVTNDFESRWHFNTSVALIMELVNELQAQEPLDRDISPLILKRVLSALILMLSPMAPHIAEELWEMLGNSVCASGERAGSALRPEVAALSRRPNARRAGRNHHPDQRPRARKDAGGR